MEARFQHFLAENRLARPGERILLAVSGGVDSMVLWHLFHGLGHPLEIAHCNFGLRGEESDADERFVRGQALGLGLPFHSRRFDTEAHAAAAGGSIQMAARELRYEWLDELRQETGCLHLATAHHLDDSIETVFLNFSRGCGIKGLHGILPRQQAVIRPLLFASKREILDYAREHGLPYREDSSNSSGKYARNLVRQQVVPALEKINPSFQRTAEGNLRRLREAEALYRFALQQIRQDIVSGDEMEWRISLGKLASYPAPQTVLHELLHPLGFNEDQVAQIQESATRQPGAVFHGACCILYVDRFYLIISCREIYEGVIEIFTNESFGMLLPTGERFSMSASEERPDPVPRGPGTVCLDFDKLCFPLRLRHWRPGDEFQPLGMGGRHQKLQDFFSNSKLSRFEKERVWLLESAGEIAWVVGMRMDERYKLAESTRRFAVFSIGS